MRNHITLLGLAATFVIAMALPEAKPVDSAFATISTLLNAPIVHPGFSFSAWVNSLIVDPGTALTPEQAIAAFEAAREVGMDAIPFFLAHSSISALHANSYCAPKKRATRAEAYRVRIVKPGTIAIRSAHGPLKSRKQSSASTILPIGVAEERTAIFQLISLHTRSAPGTTRR